MEEVDVDLDTILSEMKLELPGFVAGAVAGNDGLPIAVLTQDEFFDINMASAEFATIVSQIERCGYDLSLGRMRSSIFTTDNYHILTASIGDAPFFQIIFLAPYGNIGKARFLMGKFENRFKEALT